MPPLASPGYRPDIDGLRAIAVILVVAFHAYPERLPGGFIGVDVFFVVSGYLITRVLLHAHTERRFSLAAFYGSRIRRLFPALALVLVTTLALGWLVLLQDELRQLGRHVAAGAGFASNLLLMTETGYFETSAERKPLLHLWSLGIEEQFYAVWPLVLVLLVPTRHARLMKVTASLMAASFALNLLQSFTAPDVAYYSPFTRSFALLAGALLAQVQGRAAGHPEWQLPSALVANALSLAGLGLIAAGALLLRPYHAYPGLWGLLPTVGTLFVLVAGQRTGVNRLLLSWRGMVFIGLISYPLYLWHWPLLSFLQIIELRSPGSTLTNATLGLAMVLATLTYWLLERPLRGSGSRRTRALALAMVLVGGSGLAVAYGVIPARLAEQPTTTGDTWEFPGGELKGIETRGHIFFRFGSARETVLFIGDSNAMQYAPRLIKLITQHPRQSRSVLFAASTGCPPVPGLREIAGRCHGIVDAALEEAHHNPDIVTVVFAADWASPFGDGAARFHLDSAPGQPSLIQPEGRAGALGALERALQSSRRAGSHTILILNIPTGRELDPRHTVDRLGRTQAPVRRGLPEQDVRQRFAGFDAELRAIAARTGTELIDPVEHLCGEGFCSAIGPDGRPIYYDAKHLSPAFTRSHVSYLDATILQSP